MQCTTNEPAAAVDPNAAQTVDEPKPFTLRQALLTALISAAGTFVLLASAIRTQEWVLDKYVFNDLRQTASLYPPVPFPDDQRTAHAE